ncbi:hypothetical protein [Mucilaginibacter ginkgonis]|uniref:Uncharacterized protein n=1 Tax=Mucilaginibacter ginkgonis TaxID=2682091 RepID=A0A6I4HYS0_9SPHI|nr:hypothetical protein [Mucilaginibacter ginkgonis]QQL50387.1 hypothetical protein GO620_002715 [Mucilaginibacter ginkgonis]
MTIPYRYFKTALLIIASGYLYSCNSSSPAPGIYKDAGIPSAKRNEFHNLTDSLFAFLKAGREGAIESMISRDLMDNNANKRTRELVANQLKANKYSLFDDYYIVPKPGDDKFLNAKADSLGLRLDSVARETYIALYIPKESANQKMISLVYGKFNYGWRLDKIELAPYTKNGRAAKELFDRARSQYARGYLVDAVNSMTGAIECATPSEELLPPDHSKTSALYGIIVNQANDKYKFPLVLNNVPGKPVIFRIGTIEMKDGTYPTISYLSKISIKDTAAVREQNNAVKKIIGNVLKGIDKDKKYLVYYIYNEKPNSYTNSYSFDITDKLQ